MIKDINENQPHKVSEVVCIDCKYRLLAESGDAYLESVIAKEAIIYADALVKELKGE